MAYIDESGDDGVASVRPIDPNGASEWFVLSALVVRAEAQRETVWVRDILKQIRLEQRRTLHFQPLDDWRRAMVCASIAKLPVRCFAVISNKANMHGYRNKKAEAASVLAGRTWFYWWITRLLLERVTDFCEQRSYRDYGESRTVRLEFARRKGLRYGHLQAYLCWLRMQSKANALFLRRGDLKWSVVDPIHQIAAIDNSERAGLQLSDSIASSFYQSVTSADVSPAIALEPRMARGRNGQVFEYGLKLMPDNFLSRATPEQRRIFDHYKAATK
ncbi:DUF3800 domain-containing protein [Bradyrhizobium sp. 6(2017)]|uniref:DUF3800 domain-containing protein n=1 Tax=Bradyrhizobium sp. 6(2017) TaxID=1197460 RepID=UPI0013E1B166|nr:DUF3800 domain-containing protein [Bradyrhizobium sp. 6(2017)]QIG96192.1 DUF3800 domain-containing protein [Bradyrhizobium sp. 6(2017)]